MSVENEVRRALAATKGDPWSSRLLAEIDFLSRLLAEQGEAAGRSGAAAAGSRFTVARLDEAVEHLAVRARSDGALSRSAALAFEEALREASPLCKAYELVCVGHAHIDMNWMWGFQETTMVTIDTVRTILDLLERYPQFHFSQSQASVYRIIERYAPELVGAIRNRIAEGRWEVSAAQWVESDMNLPSGESLARQMLYARRYLMERFGAPEEAFRLLFLPDTFGHNANTPEILGAAGVRYLYHCRGAAGPHLSRWEAPSGRAVLAYREPRWYNTDVGWDVAEFLPRFARETGLSAALCVYGVGDHGGGPTVRDIERLSAMGGWPLFPKVTFGTLRGYFERIAALGIEVPTVRGERNMIFTGCYTSQSRIKMASRSAERLLYEAELAFALAGIRCGMRPSDTIVGENLKEAWTKTLFSHFHDILPGSGVQLTREFALGSFQETAAAALAAQSEALRRLAAAGTGGAGGLQQRTGGQSGARGARAAGEAVTPDIESRSEGAGAGFGTERFELPAVERGRGRSRRYLLFNPLQWKREAVVDLTVWDWQGEEDSIECTDDSGRRLDHQVVASGTDAYWGHTFVRLKLSVAAPAFGFAGVEVRERPAASERSPFFPYGVAQWLVEEPARAVLQNSRLRATFDPVSMSLLELVDRATGTRLCGGGFRLVEEEAERMTAWIVGRYQRVVPLASAARIVEATLDPSLPEQWISYEAELPRRGDGPASRLTVRVSLARDASRLRFEVDCHWLEIGVAKERVPQLQYALSLEGEWTRLRCDMPFGTIDRAAQALDVPANSFGAAIPRSASSPLVQLTLDSRHAFRFHDNSLQATLLRSSVDPDPYPEIGRHQLSFALSILPASAAGDPSASIREALEVCHPLRALSAAGGGSGANGEGGLLSVEGAGCIVAAVKRAEPPAWEASRSGEAECLIVRLYDANGRGGEATVALPGGAAIASARRVDLHERPVAGGAAAGSASAGIEPLLASGAVRVALAPYEVVTLELQIEK